MNNYTKGPWMLNREIKQKHGIVSQISTPEGYPIGEWLDAENDGFCPNARLIAAAPEMLEMLKTIYTQLGEDMIDNNIPDKIYDLWAKYHNDMFNLINKIEGGER